MLRKKQSKQRSKNKARRREEKKKKPFRIWQDSIWHLFCGLAGCLRATRCNISNVFWGRAAPTLPPPQHLIYFFYCIFCCRCDVFVASVLQLHSNNWLYAPRFSSFLHHFLLYYWDFCSAFFRACWYKTRTNKCVRPLSSSSLLLSLLLLISDSLTAAIQ